MPTDTVHAHISTHTTHTCTQHTCTQLTLNTQHTAHSTQHTAHTLARGAVARGAAEAVVVSGDFETSQLVKGLDVKDSCSLVHIQRKVSEGGNIRRGSEFQERALAEDQSEMPSQ